MRHLSMDSRITSLSPISLWRSSSLAKVTWAPLSSTSSSIDYHASHFLASCSLNTTFHSHSLHYHAPELNLNQMNIPLTRLTSSQLTATLLSSLISRHGHFLQAHVSLKHINRTCIRDICIRSVICGTTRFSQGVSRHTFGRRASRSYMARDIVTWSWFGIRIYTAPHVT